ncbi:hypothetical protein PQC34_gp012 [Cronobacter phage A24]|uniref:Uncharacterized protein n=1 Tax=Cronobacter phage A24 TaxID=2795745 RepID=A0A7T5QXW1_9CAUD|nr:hypothetical protein PQC34_gp012 [Cronobacter phage A24]QQG33722.1 hypothetical protein [Cronobacter phage A24]
MINRKGFGIRQADGTVVWFYNSNPRSVKV